MRILLTGGRAPVCLDLARQLWRAGHKVFVAESQRFHVSRSSRAVRRNFTVPPPRQEPSAFVNAIVRIVREHEIDVLVPTCEEIFYLARARSQLASICRVWVDELEKLGELHDKFRFAEFAARTDFNVPQSYLVHSSSELAEHLAREGEWILKPTFSRFGRTLLRGSVRDLVEARPTMGEGRSWVLQRFVGGREVCAYAVFDDGVLKAMSLYAHEFVAGRAGVTFEEVEVPRVERQIANFARHLNFTGQLAFDFILTAEGTPYVLECNPRATSGVHLLAREAKFTEVFTAPERVLAPVRARRGTRAMLGLPTVVFGLAQIRSLPKFKAWTRTLARSRDAIFCATDLLPFFDQVICTFALVLEAWRAKLDPLAVSTADIEWNGPS